MVAIELIFIVDNGPIKPVHESVSADTMIVTSTDFTIMVVNLRIVNDIDRQWERVVWTAIILLCTFFLIS